jgi:hypothetical protein
MIDLWLDDERDPEDRLIQEMFDSLVLIDPTFVVTR